MKLEYFVKQNSKKIDITGIKKAIKTLFPAENPKDCRKISVSIK